MRYSTVRVVIRCYNPPSRELLCILKFPGDFILIVIKRNFISLLLPLVPPSSALGGRKDAQSLGFFNRLTTLADVKLPVDVLQVSFDGGC